LDASFVIESSGQRVQRTNTKAAIWTRFKHN
jgi:hypothetical protein